MINLTPSLEIIDPGSDLVIFLSSQVELRRFLWPLVGRRWALGCSLLRMCCCCCCLVIRELCTNVASAQAVLEVSKYTQQATQSAKLDAAPSYPRPSSMWKPESLKIADTSRLPSDQRVIAIICLLLREIGDIVPWSSLLWPQTTTANRGDKCWHWCSDK